MRTLKSATVLLPALVLSLGQLADHNSWASEPAGTFEAAKAWYVALDAKDDGAAASIYVDAAIQAKWQRDLARFRGTPVEFGEEVLQTSGDGALLQLHAGTGQYFLASWRRGPGGWKIIDVVDLAAELFLDRRQEPTVAVWPSESAAAESPAGVVYRLVSTLHHREKKELSQKELEASFFHPSGPGDRDGYPAFVQSLQMFTSLPEVVAISEAGDPAIRTAKGVVHAQDKFEVQFAKTGGGWRVTSAHPFPRPDSRKTARAYETLLYAARDNALAAARRAVAALTATDASTFAEISLDLAATTPRPPSIDGAKVRMATLRAKFGSRFTVSSEGAVFKGTDLKHVSFQAAAPDFEGDSKTVRVVLVLVGGAWRLLDVNDGLNWLQATVEEVTPGK